jgi:hypothetical protein
MLHDERFLFSQIHILRTLLKITPRENNLIGFRVFPIRSSVQLLLSTAVAITENCIRVELYRKRERIQG